jgi:hypothetical protein
VETGNTHVLRMTFQGRHAGLILVIPDFDQA